MFTGLIHHLGHILSAQQAGDLQMRIACAFADDLRIGDSVAVNGACLTVTDKGDDWFSVSLSEETLLRTAPRWQPGACVHLERPLKLGDMLDGHMLTGHIDGTVLIRNITPVGDSLSFRLEAPEGLERFIAEKGSLALDGVSLTVNKVEGRDFWVNIIPHTWGATTFGERKAGDALNLEIDMIARYVARLLQKP